MLERRGGADNVAGGAGYTLWSGSKYKDAAWALLRFLESEKGQALFAESGIIVPARRSIREDNIFLRESFRKQLFSGFLFRDYRFTYSGDPHKRKVSLSIIHGAEISGLEIFGINTLYNALADESDAGSRLTIQGTRHLYVARPARARAAVVVVQGMPGSPVE